MLSFVLFKQCFKSILKDKYQALTLLPVTNRHQILRKQKKCTCTFMSQFPILNKNLVNPNMGVKQKSKTLAHFKYKFYDLMEHFVSICYIYVIES